MLITVFSQRDAFRLGRRIPPAGLVDVEVQRVISDAGPLWIPTADDVLRDQLLSNRQWEPEISAALLESVAGAATFLDIGANIGYFSRLVARANANCVVHAFEPHPLTHRVLDLNTWEFGDRVCCWPIGASDAVGVSGMQTEPHNLGDTHFVPTDIATMLVPVAPIDVLLPDQKVDLVKVDVQGAELAVLRGMSRTISQSPRIRIFLEFWPSRIIEDGLPPHAVLEAYRSMGFSIRYRREGAWLKADDRELLEFCGVSGRFGQADLLLSKI